MQKNNYIKYVIIKNQSSKLLLKIQKVDGGVKAEISNSVCPITITCVLANNERIILKYPPHVQT